MKSRTYLTTNQVSSLTNRASQREKRLEHQTTEGQLMPLQRLRFLQKAVRLQRQCRRVALAIRVLPHRGRPHLHTVRHLQKNQMRGLARSTIHLPL